MISRSDDDAIPILLTYNENTSIIKLNIVIGVIFLEKWKCIEGYEDLYEVSNTGFIRTKEGKTTFTKRHGIRKWKQRILKDKTPNGRDYRIALWKDGKVKYFLAHRLVAIAFFRKK